MSNTVTFQSGRSQKHTPPTVRELHILEDARYRLRRAKNGVEEILDIDFRTAYSGWHKQTEGDPYFDNVLSTYNTKNRTNIHIVCGGDIEIRTIRLYNYTGPYPKLVYLREGETETSAEQLIANPGTRPGWIRIEPAEERAKREREENLVDWMRIAHRMARHHFEADNIRSLATKFAKRHLPNPVVLIPVLSRQIGTEVDLIDDLVDISDVHRLKLIGLLIRIIKLYENNDNAKRLIISRDTEWAVGKTYKVGDYEKYTVPDPKPDDATHVQTYTCYCEKAHTATADNSPKGDGGNDFWNRNVVLDKIPSSFTFDEVKYEQKKDTDGNIIYGEYDRVVTPKNVTIDLETGEGVLDFIKCLTQEFNYHLDYAHHEQFPVNNLHESDTIPNDPLFFFAGILNAADDWTRKIAKYELWTSKLETKDPIKVVPNKKIYSSKVEHIEKRNANQIADAKEHTTADWVSLYDNFFEALFHNVQPSALSPWHRSPGQPQ